MVWTLFWIVAGCFIWLGNRFANIALYPENWDHESSRNREMQDQPVELSYFDSIEKEAFEIISSREQKIRGFTINGDKADRLVIFSHGITYNLYGAVKYLKMFHEWGFNIVIYDQANHGNSEGHVTTFGYYEKNDLKDVVDFALAKWKNLTIVGVHGESMGAATALQHAQMDKRISFVVSDCSFDTAWNEFKYRLKVEKHLPAFPTLYIASLFSYMKSGVFFSRMNPLEAVSKLEIPVLWIHGLADDYTPSDQTGRLYNAHKGKKQLYLVEGARHAKSYHVDPEGYRKQVEGFLRDNVFEGGREDVGL
jgi:pimeloyl-ACP methyl ester carboxylesterase